MTTIAFDNDFKALTGTSPFPWQRRLYQRFVEGRLPATCALPTGLGKTSVIAIWLLARKVRPSLPRRLVYVVNRRTVVDQTTTEVERLRERRVEAGLEDFAVSTLRGALADNREWSEDPSRAAVIAGTVDMIGSRLLFSGYRIGFRTRPLHAAFLAQDALLVHDEAHLEPAFQALLDQIVAEQRRCGDRWPLRVLQLSATLRTDEDPINVIQIDDSDRAEPIVRQRMFATKRVHLHECEDKAFVAEAVARIASYEKAGVAVLVFARTVEAVTKILGALKATKLRAVPLTGTMRGYERDKLVVEDPVLARFLPERDRRCAAAEGTVVLVCTSAGEVGVNLSADHLVSDLSSFDSMAQRLGRVNRFGTRTDTEVHVYHPPEAALDAEIEKGKDGVAEIAERRLRTLALFRLLEGDGSPDALGKLPAAARIAAFTPAPEILPVNEILFDAWAATSIRARLPGRPRVDEYLHGVAAWEPPSTQIAWRDEVDLIKPSRWKEFPPTDLLEDYPLKPHEVLADRTSRVLDALLARLDGVDEPAELESRDVGFWVVESEGQVRHDSLSALKHRITGPASRKAAEAELDGATILLPPSLCRPVDGLFTEESWAVPGPESAAGDVADEWGLAADGAGLRRRRRDLDLDQQPGMRRVRSISLADDTIETPSTQEWRWYEVPKGADGDGPRESRQPVLLTVHSEDVRRWAATFVKALALPDDLARAVETAAAWHDLGKVRRVWQRSLGNRDPELVLAKGGNKLHARDLTAYRHELGSMFDAPSQPGWQSLDDEQRDLVLHLVAAHHGRARPCFPSSELFDPESPQRDVAAEGLEVMRRFVRLQRRFGRWGLAYLESLVRAADYKASADPSAFVGGAS